MLLYILLRYLFCLMNAFKLYDNGRMARASLSPIDVITGETLRSTGPDELGAVLARRQSGL
ncbi:TonB-dependent receptor [Pseudomonas synxantha]|nr:TonB-dependent receptor [Pseudomonas synxantha]